ncbi:hypothetical protein QFC22_006542 [Naganishia vaughanmartiniae]|uniref:Uncharacterized protein n=1 Tax=Naganishia vaughanmartiniae TaxID=1424756 RepID=A0ACC2WL07_9TREE|nr:hypothetical protein QFC22_006542 [Naganishia vaughanmartiniae]
MSNITQHSRSHLEKLKIPELKAICKQSKITGYSKLKRSDLIKKIFQATNQPGTTIPQALIESSSRIVLPVQPPAHHQSSIQSSFAVPSTPFLDDTPLTVQSTILATPAGTRSPTLDYDNVPAVATQAFAFDSRSASSPAYNNTLGLLSSLQTDKHVSSMNASLAFHMPASTASIGEQWVLTNDAAVSLKEMVQKQREKKRKAEENLSSTTTLQKGKKKVSRLDISYAKKTSAAPPVLGNALQLTNMDPATLLQGTNASTSTIGEHGSALPMRFQPTAHLLSFPTQVNPSHTSSKSTSRNSRPSTTASNFVTKVILPGNRALDEEAEHATLTTGYNLALPSGQLLDSTIQSMNSDATDETAIAKTSAMVQSSEREGTTLTVKPLRRGNPKMGPLKKSVIPCDDTTLRSSTSSSTASFGLPRIVPGTAPLSTSEHIKINVRKNTIGVKLGNISKFAAPALIQHPASSHSTKILLPSLSEEEPLLFKCEWTSDTISTAKSTGARTDLTARMTKSWLYRFYQQLASARSDAMNQSPHTSSGSRSPTGLPGMSAGFVYSATTIPEQFNVAITFVIARIHTLIQGDDWIGLIKEEDVEKVTKIGGGIWEVATRLQVIDDTARNIGGPSAFKTRKCIYTVIGETGEVIAKSEANDSRLRAEWRSYIAAIQNDATISLLDYLKTKDDTSYPHGIAAGWSVKAKRDPRLEEAYHMAERYILSNVMPNSCSGDYRSSLQMDAMWIGQGATTVQPRRPKVSLYLPESHQVESVSFIARGAPQDRPLHSSVAIVKRKTAEDFVLRETGQVIGNAEDSEIAMVWQCLLGCEASGVAAPTAKAKEITAQFWTGLNDDMVVL